VNDTSLIPLLIAGSIVTTLFVFYIILFIIINKNKHRRYQMEKKEMEFRFANELLLTRLEVQEQALNQVSQEIHDNIGQTLSIAQLNLLSINKNNDVLLHAELIENSKSLLAKAITDLRNVSHVLNSDNINRIGLEESIKKELNYLSSFRNLKFEVTTSGEPDNLSDEKELMVFRIAQEALANIAKHANASFVQVNLQYQPSSFAMEIKDNGIGFNADEKKKDERSGIGLSNMKQRAAVMEGDFILSSGSGGTTINLTIPL
jgi:signal transduction histidine kinase